MHPNRGVMANWTWLEVLVKFLKFDDRDVIKSGTPPRMWGSPGGENCPDSKILTWGSFLHLHFLHKFFSFPWKIGPR